MDRPLSRRALFHLVGAASSSLVFFNARRARAQVAAQATRPLPTFTGPGANPYWTSTNPFAVYPQKLPLIRLTDRTIQLETPQQYFGTPFTPNEAFFVRYHLDQIPNQIDLTQWRLRVEGNVARPLTLSLEDLLKRFTPVSIAAVNQCAGNSRSRFEPRVPGGQWGNGAMGNARWTGVRLRDVLQAATLQSGTVQIQFEGLERGPGPAGKGSHEFMKSIDAGDSVLDQTIIAYLMNGEPLPMLNGFPVRLVVPGKFGTYWLKHLTWIRALTQEDRNFWMDPAYRIPDTPRGDTTPADIAGGRVKTVPIGHVNMPVRSFFVSPDGAAKIPVGVPFTIRGIAFSGYGGVAAVDVSVDGGRTWARASLGEDYGPYSFRTWTYAWTPGAPGSYALAARASDEKGNVQPDTGVWNPGGYLWNKIERQTVVVGAAS